MVLPKPATSRETCRYHEVAVKTEDWQNMTKRQVYLRFMTPIVFDILFLVLIVVMVLRPWGFLSDSSISNLPAVQNNASNLRLPDPANQSSHHQQQHHLGDVLGHMSQVPPILGEIHGSEPAGSITLPKEMGLTGVRQKQQQQRHQLSSSRARKGFQGSPKTKRLSHIGDTSLPALPQQARPRSTTAKGYVLRRPVLKAPRVG